MCVRVCVCVRNEHADVFLWKLYDAPSASIVLPSSIGCSNLHSGTLIKIFNCLKSRVCNQSLLQVGSLLFWKIPCILEIQESLKVGFITNCGVYYTYEFCQMFIGQIIIIIYQLFGSSVFLGVLEKRTLHLWLKAVSGSFLTVLHLAIWTMLWDQY